VDDLKSCRVDATRFCIPGKTATEVFWQKAIEPARQNCRRRSVEDDQPVVMYDDPSGLKAAAETDTCDFFMELTSIVTVASENEYCNKLTVVGDAFSPLTTGFVLPRNSNLTMPMSNATLQLQQQDKLQTPIEYGVVRECKELSQTRLTWRRMAIFFEVSYATLVIMILLMLIDPRPQKAEEAADEEEAVVVEEQGSSAAQST
jgi:hypothetical protein